MSWNNGVVVQLGITDSYQGSTGRFASHYAIRYGSHSCDASQRDQFKLTIDTGEGINFANKQKCICIGIMACDEIPLAPPSLNVGDR